MDRAAYVLVFLGLVVALVAGSAILADDDLKTSEFIWGGGGFNRGGWGPWGGWGGGWGGPGYFRGGPWGGGPWGFGGPYGGFSGGFGPFGGGFGFGRFGGYWY